MAWCGLFLAVLLGGALLCRAADSSRAGTVEFSNGKTIAGKLSLTPGRTLRIQAGAKVNVLTLDELAEIRFAPAREEMDRNWRFKEAGQTAKEYFGKPYPVRYLKTTATLAGGERISGHLYTTVLYVETADGNTEKVILPAKQRGAEGESMQSLVYPARISFAGTGADSVGPETLRLKLRGVVGRAEVVALTRGGLVRLEAKALDEAGEYRLPSSPGKGFFLAIKSGRKLIVGWPGNAPAQTMALVRKALAESTDFFDDRRLMGVVSDNANSEIYSLVLALRKGKTTLNQKRSQPWRLEILRWKRGDENRLMLAGRGYFFRGVLARGEPPPIVEFAETLWKVRKDGNFWTTGK